MPTSPGRRRRAWVPAEAAAHHAVYAAHADRAATLFATLDHHDQQVLLGLMRRLLDALAATRTAEGRPLNLDTEAFRAADRGLSEPTIDHARSVLVTTSSLAAWRAAGCRQHIPASSGPSSGSPTPALRGRMLSPLVWPFMRIPEQGAETSVWLVSPPRLKGPW